LPITVPTAVYAYAGQHETDNANTPVKYPGSYIPTLDVERLREADVLSTDAATAAQILPGGYLHLIMKIAPNYASNEYLSKLHYLVYANNKFGLWFDLQNQKMVLESKGMPLQSDQGPITWSREQELTIEVLTGPTGRMFSLSGATNGSFSVSDTLVEPWPTNLPLYFLGTNNGEEESADLRYIGFFPPN